MSALLDAALGYIGRGFRVVPVQPREKKPWHNGRLIEDWPALEIGEADAPRYFNGKDRKNIGCVMGYGALADADLDCPGDRCGAFYSAPHGGVWA